MRRRRPRRWDAVPRQDGRRFVVTGASGGLGLETARVLARRGAQMVLAVRDPAKGAAAAATIPGTVEVRRLDVADLGSVREFASGLGPVDVLVNNAGVLAVPFALTVDGFETHLATNHLGHFALANLLLPTLRDRVVVVTSHAHRAADLDLDDLGWERRPYRPFAAYGASKLANLLFVAELQRRLTATGSTLRVTAAHPGSTATGSPPTPAAGPRPGSARGATGSPACRRGRARSRRCTPPRWTCPATPSSAPAGRWSSPAGRPASDAARTRATPTWRSGCGSAPRS